jgi:hypothetical protein
MEADFLSRNQMPDWCVAVMEVRGHLLFLENWLNFMTTIPGLKF